MEPDGIHLKVLRVLVDMIARPLSTIYLSVFLVNQGGPRGLDVFSKCDSHLHEGL